MRASTRECDRISDQRSHTVAEIVKKNFMCDGACFVYIKYKMNDYLGVLCIKFRFLVEFYMYLDGSAKMNVGL